MNGNTNTHSHNTRPKESAKLRNKLAALQGNPKAGGGCGWWGKNKNLFSTQLASCGHLGCD